MKLKHALMAAFCASTVGASSASAVVMTRTYDFTASLFNLTNGGGVAPYPVVTGSFSVTFDNAITTLNGTGVVVNNLSIAYAGPVNFQYYTSGDILAITNGDYISSTRNTNDFAIDFRDATTSLPLGRSFNYSQVGFDNVATTRTVVVNNGSVAAVPEPSSWAMLTIGFGLIGGTIRRRQIILREGRL